MNQRSKQKKPGRAIQLVLKLFTTLIASSIQSQINHENRAQKRPQRLLQSQESLNHLKETSDRPNPAPQNPLIDKNRETGFEVVLDKNRLLIENTTYHITQTEILGGVIRPGIFNLNKTNDSKDSNITFKQWGYITTIAETEITSPPSSPKKSKKTNKNNKKQSKIQKLSTLNGSTTSKEPEADNLEDPFHEIDGPVLKAMNFNTGRVLLHDYIAVITKNSLVLFYINSTKPASSNPSPNVLVKLDSLDLSTLYPGLTEILSFTNTIKTGDYTTDIAIMYGEGPVNKHLAVINITCGGPAQSYQANLCKVEGNPSIYVYSLVLTSISQSDKTINCKSKLVYMNQTSAGAMASYNVGRYCPLSQLVAQEQSDWINFLEVYTKTTESGELIINNTIKTVNSTDSPASSFNLQLLDIKVLTDYVVMVNYNYIFVIEKPTVTDFTAFYSNIYLQRHTFARCFNLQKNVMTCYLEDFTETSPNIIKKSAYVVEFVDNNQNLFKLPPIKLSIPLNLDYSLEGLFNEFIILKTQGIQTEIILIERQNYNYVWTEVFDEEVLMIEPFNFASDPRYDLLDLGMIILNSSKISPTNNKKNQKLKKFENFPKNEIFGEEDLMRASPANGSKTGSLRLRIVNNHYPYYQITALTNNQNTVCMQYVDRCSFMHLNFSNGASSILLPFFHINKNNTSIFPIYKNSNFTFRFAGGAIKIVLSDYFYGVEKYSKIARVNEMPETMLNNVRCGEGISKHSNNQIMVAEDIFYDPYNPRRPYWAFVTVLPEDEVFLSYIYNTPTGYYFRALIEPLYMDYSNTTFPDESFSNAFPLTKEISFALLIKNQVYRRHCILYQDQINNFFNLIFYSTNYGGYTVYTLSSLSTYSSGIWTQSEVDGTTEYLIHFSRTAVTFYSVIFPSSTNLAVQFKQIAQLGMVADLAIPGASYINGVSLIKGSILAVDFQSESKHGINFYHFCVKNTTIKGRIFADFDFAVLDPYNQGKTNYSIMADQGLNYVYVMVGTDDVNAIHVLDLNFYLLNPLFYSQTIQASFSIQSSILGMQLVNKAHKGQNSFEQVSKDVIIFVMKDEMGNLNILTLNSQDPLSLSKIDNLGGLKNDDIYWTQTASLGELFGSFSNYNQQTKKLAFRLVWISTSFQIDHVSKQRSKTPSSNTFYTPKSLTDPIKLQIPKNPKIEDFKTQRNYTLTLTSYGDTDLVQDINGEVSFPLNISQRSNLTKTLSGDIQIDTNYKGVIFNSSVYCDDTTHYFYNNYGLSKIGCGKTMNVTLVKHIKVWFRAVNDLDLSTYLGVYKDYSEIPNLEGYLLLLTDKLAVIKLENYTYIRSFIDFTSHSSFVVSHCSSILTVEYTAPDKYKLVLLCTPFASRTYLVQIQLTKDNIVNATPYNPNCTVQKSYGIPILLFPINEIFFNSDILQSTLTSSTQYHYFYGLLVVLDSLQLDSSTKYYLNIYKISEDQGAAVKECLLWSTLTRDEFVDEKPTSFWVNTTEIGEYEIDFTLVITFESETSLQTQAYNMSYDQKFNKIEFYNYSTTDIIELYNVSMVVNRQFMLAKDHLYLYIMGEKLINEYVSTDMERFKYTGRTFKHVSVCGVDTKMEVFKLGEFTLLHCVGKLAENMVDDMIVFRGDGLNLDSNGYINPDQLIQLSQIKLPFSKVIGVFEDNGRNFLVTTHSLNYFVQYLVDVESEIDLEFNTESEFEKSIFFTLANTFESPAFDIDVKVTRWLLFRRMCWDMVERASLVLIILGIYFTIFLTVLVKIRTLRLVLKRKVEDRRAGGGQKKDKAYLEQYLDSRIKKSISKNRLVNKTIYDDQDENDLLLL